jgi:hemerythrin-like metal-binding protein
MNFIKWNDETMSIGIMLIDNQHKELLKIINKLSSSIHNNSQRIDILEILDELINYADYHFSTEEELFDKFDYEENEAHKKEHSLFVEEFTELRNKITQDKIYMNKSAIEISERVFNYIVKWFLNHVVGSDRKFVELFKENKIR